VTTDGTAKRALVVVRAGPSSLHEGWLSDPPARRSFDVVVSYYSAEAHAAHADQPGVRAVLVPGGKWDGLHATLAQVDWRAYRRVWLPDDDIATDGTTIERMLDVAERHDLAVAQPSLSRDSYYTFFLLSRCRAFEVRRVTFVESMVPLLTAAVLDRMLPEFAATMSGFGLDRAWSRLPEARGRVAVIDAVAVHHTRPVGGVLRRAMAAAGRRPEDEAQAVAARHGLTGRLIPMATGGVLADGRELAGPRSTGLAMLRSWWSDRRTFRDPARARADMLKVVKRQVLYRPEGPQP
jgi:hypothetical protein